MNLIKHLTHTITPTIMANSLRLDDTDPFYEQLLLEQFYAIAMARLTDPQVQERLVEHQASLYSDSYQDDVPTDYIASGHAESMFDSLWPVPTQRQQIISALSDTYYSLPDHSHKLITLALPLLYKELVQLSHSKDMPLHKLINDQPESIRAYIPTWAAELIKSSDNIAYVKNDASSSRHVNDTADQSEAEDSAAPSHDNSMAPNNSIAPNNSDVPSKNPLKEPTQPKEDESREADEAPVVQNLPSLAALFNEEGKREEAVNREDVNHGNTAVHANPTDYRDGLKLANSPPAKKTLSLPRIIALLGLLLLAGLVWLAISTYQQSKSTAALERPYDETNDMATTPVAPQELASQTTMTTTLKPAKLTIRMDVDQKLYDCQARVGNAALREALVQALSLALGTQAQQCLINIEPNVATDMPSLHNLTGIVSAISSVPFATLQLEGNNLSLSAPDQSLLSQMTDQIQSLAPALNITTLAPILPDSPVDTSIEPDSHSEAKVPLNQDGSATVIALSKPDKALNKELSGLPSSSASGGYAQNKSSSVPSSAAYTSDSAASGYSSTVSSPVSERELASMMDTIIVAEPAQGGHPISSSELPYE